MFKQVYEIVVDGEGVGMFYIADSKEDAIKKHIKRLAELYFISFNKKPNMSFFDGINAKESIVVHE